MALQDTQPDNKNFLSPIGFQFSIQKLPHVNYFCQSANIPEITLSEVERMSPFIKLPTPGTQLTFGALSITFRVDEDLKNYKEMYNWMIGLGFPDNFEQRLLHGSTSIQDCVVRQHNLVLQQVNAILMPFDNLVLYNYLFDQY